MAQPTTYVGIDVAKDGVDIAVRPTGHSWHTPYDEAEVTLLVAKLQDLKPARVVMEATGGLEVPLAAALAAAVCRWPWSTPDRSGILPNPLGGWPRLTPWMLMSGPILPRRFAPRYVHYLTTILRNSTH